MTKHELTIIIPSFHPDYHEQSRKALGFCLPSLEETFSGQVIVAYNGEGSEYNQGQCQAVNRIAKQVNTPWIMVSNNDMIYPPGWFEKMSQAIENFGLLVASPNLVEPQKGAPPFIQKFCGGAGTEGTDPDFNKQCFLDFVAGYKEHENRPIENLVEDGFNLPYLIRRDVWETVGGYDESYDPWGSCSDTDLQTRLMIAGITPKRVRNTLVYHFSNVSGTFTADRESFRHANWRYYESKFGFPSPNTQQGVWYKPEITWNKLKFHPEWEAKYA